MTLVKIKDLTLVIGKKEIVLSPQEAIDLYNVLRDFMCKNDGIKYYPTWTYSNGTSANNFSLTTGDTIK
jgi:hypothetical protein